METTNVQSTLGIILERLYNHKYMKIPVEIFEQFVDYITGEKLEELSIEKFEMLLEEYESRFQGYENSLESFLHILIDDLYFSELHNEHEFIKRYFNYDQCISDLENDYFTFDHNDDTYIFSAY